MIKSFFGLKGKTIQTFDKKGRRLPITFLKVSPLVIKSIKTEKKDGYPALQVAFKKQKKEILREIKIEDTGDFKKGEKIKVDQVFKEDDEVKIRGRSKGKGFAGVVKRWGFKGGPKTHGQSDRERAPGAIGQGTDPGRVWKGKKMAGRMGGRIALIKGLKIFKIDEEKGLMAIIGVIPGARRGVVEIIKET